MRARSPSFPWHAAVLAATCLPWRLSDAGVGLPLPVSTAVLLVGTVVFLVRRRGPLPAPHPTLGHAVLAALLAFGLLGLSRPELPVALYKAAQVFEILGVSWLLFLALPAEAWGGLTIVGGALCIGLSLLGAAAWMAGEALGLSEAKRCALMTLSLPFLLLALKAAPAGARWATLAGICALAGLTMGNAGLLLSFAAVLLLACRLLDRRWLLPAVGLAATALLLSAVSPALLCRSSAWETLNPSYDASHPRRLFFEYRAAVAALDDYPLGGGLGQYQRVINVARQSLPVQPHPEDKRVPQDAQCQYLVTMVEAGLPAGCALLLCLGLAAAGALRGLREAPTVERERRAVVAAALCGALLAGCFCLTLSRDLGIWIGALLGLAAGQAPPSSGRAWLRRWGAVGLAWAAGFLLLTTVNLSADPISHLSTLNRKAAGLLGRAPLDVAEAQRADGRLSDGGLEIIQLDDIGPSRLLRIEAEDYAEADVQFQKIPANDASGNRVVEIPQGIGKGKGQATYRVQIPAAGRYEISLRVWWLDGCSNSLGVSVAGETSMVSSEVFRRWHDLSCRKLFELPAGEVTIVVRNLEDGVRYDYLELRRR